ncbi:MAG: terpene cyclase/mutase family protein [Pirellulales bacterium]|nr:terpene cyclase/mutase family protein [Pirellulales bacterium]
MCGRWFILLIVIFGIRQAGAQQRRSPERDADRWITPAVEKGVERGLRWLADQQHENGSFAAGSARGNAAVCGLAGMAFLSAGSTPGRGPYGRNVDRCVDYLLSCAQPSGFINGPDTATHGPMYGHGFATLFLAECYGMSARPDLHEKLSAAVRLIVNTQNKEGGWRYFPRITEDADISVTVCEVMALRAARNVGIFVPKETIDGAVRYVKRSQNADGGFMYMLQGGESAFPRSAAGVVALYSAGVYEGPEIEKGLDYLSGFLSAEATPRRETYYYYGQYYAVQAFWQAGGKRWGRYFPAVRDELLSRQRPDGAWMSPNGIEYATAMACIVLQLPNDYLPIFQR